MPTVANLAMVVESQGVKVAAQDLDHLATSAQKAGTATDTLDAKFERYNRQLQRTALATGQYRDAQGRLRDEHGRFVASAGHVGDAFDRMGQQQAVARRATLAMTDAVVGLRSAWGAFAALGVTAALGTLTTRILDVSQRYEQMQASLTTVTGSATAAGAAFNALQSFAATTPYGVEEATKAFITLRSRGLDPTIAAMTSYGNTASAMGKSLDQMIEAVADAVTGENERLKEFGITANSMGDKVAFTFRGVTTTVRKNAGEIEQYLQSIGNTNFSGAMDAQSKTLAGAFAALGDSADALAYRIGQGGLADSVNQSARALSQLASDGNGAADWLGSYLGSRVETATGLFVRLVDQVGKLKAALESLPGGSGFLSDFMSGASSGMTAGVGSAAIAGLGNAAYGAASRWWNGDSAQTDNRVNDAFNQFGQAGQAAGTLQDKLNDLALKGVPTLQDAINRAALNPTDTILSASGGRLRQDQAAGLQPDMARQLASAIAEATAAGLNPVVTEAFRTFADQAALYMNRASNSNPVAQPGTSAHEKGVAVDISIKGMSADELRMLQSIMEKYGFNQPVANDPVHWLFGGESGLKYLSEQRDAAAKAALEQSNLSANVKNTTESITGSTVALGQSAYGFDEYSAAARDAQDALSVFGDAALSMLDALRQPADNLADALGSIAMNFADMTAAAVLTGEGPMAGILGYSGQNGQQGGLLGMLAGNDLSGVFKDATRSGVKLGIGDAIQAGQPMDLTGGLSGQSGGGLMQGLTAGAGAVSSLGAAYVGGTQSGDPVMGGISGAISGGLGGLALLPLLGSGPVGWVAAGVMALAGGVLGATGANSTSNKGEEQARLANYMSQMASRKQFVAEAGGEAYGTIESTLDSAFSTMQSLASTIQQMGDPTGALTLELNGLYEAYGKLGGRLNDEFVAAFQPTLDALSSGQGLSGAFGSARTSIIETGETLRDFVDDARESHDTYGRLYDGAVQDAQKAAQEYALSLLDPVDSLSTVQTRLEEIEGTAAGLRQVLEDLGMSASEAAEAISAKTIVALDSLRSDFLDELGAATNTALDKGYINDAADLVEQYTSNLADAAALGLDSSAVDQWFAAEAQAIVNSAELTGTALSDLTAQFPALTGVVADYSDFVARTADEISSVVDGYDDRLFAALNDASTLTGKLREFDRAANKERAAEVEAGGEAIVELEAALMAERVGVIKDALATGWDAVVSDFSDLASAYDSARETLRETARALRDFSDDIGDFLDTLKLSDDLSTLSAVDQLSAARSQYNTTLAAAKSGDQDAIGSLTSAAETYLSEARDYYSATDAYASVFSAVEAQLKAVQAALDADVGKATDVVSIDEQQLSIDDALLAFRNAQADYTSALSTIAQIIADGGDLIDVSGFISALDGAETGVADWSKALGSTDGALEGWYDALENTDDGVNKWLKSLRDSNDGMTDWISTVGDSETGIDGWINVLSGTKDGITNWIGALSGTKDGVTKWIDKLSGTKDGITKWMDKLSGTNDGITNWIGALSGTKDGVTKWIDKLSGTKDGITKWMDKLSGTNDGITNWIGALSGTKDGVTKWIDKLSGTKDGITKWMDKLSGTKDGITNWIGALSGTKDGVTKWIDKLSGTKDGITKWMDKLSGTKDGITNWIGALSGTKDGVTKWIDKLSGTKDGITKWMDKLSGTKDGITNWIGALSGTKDGVTKWIDKLSGTKDGITKWMDKLSGTKDGITNWIGALSGTKDGVTKWIDKLSGTKDGITKWMDKLSGTNDGITNWIGALSGTKDGVTKWIDKLSGTKDGITKWMDKLSGTNDGITNWIGALSGTKDGVTKWIDKLSGTKDGITKWMDKLSGTKDGITNWIGALSGTKDGVTKWIDKLSGTKDGITKWMDKLSGTKDGITNWIGALSGTKDGVTKWIDKLSGTKDGITKWMDKLSGTNDGITNWIGALSGTKDGVTKWIDKLSGTKDGITKWMDKLSGTNDGITNWIGALSGTKDGVTKWIDKLSGTKDGITKWGASVTSGKDSLTAWNKAIDSGTTKVGSLSTAIKDNTTALGKNLTVTGISTISTNVEDVTKAIKLLKGYNSTESDLTSDDVYSEFEWVLGELRTKAYAASGFTEEIRNWMRDNITPDVAAIRKRFDDGLSVSVDMGGIGDILKNVANYTANSAWELWGIRTILASDASAAARQNFGAIPAWTQPYRLGGVVGAYAAGGMVGNGLWDVDSVLARYAGGGNIALAGGEYVVRAPSVNDNTMDALAHINATGRLPGVTVGTSRTPDVDMSGVISAIQVGITALHRAIREESRESRSSLETGVDAIVDSVTALRAEIRSGSRDPRLRKTA